MAISTPVAAGTNTPTTPSASGTISTTTTQTVPSGGKLWVHAGWWSATATASSVTAGALTGAVDNQLANGNTHKALLYVDCPAGLASGSTVTVTLSASDGDSRFISLEYVTGAASGGSASRVSGTGATAAWSSGTVAVGSSDILIGGALGNGNGVANTPAGGNTEIADFNIAADSSMTTCYQFGTGASVASQGTWAAPLDWSAVGSVWGAAAGGGPPARTPLLEWLTQGGWRRALALQFLRPEPVPAAAVLTSVSATLDFPVEALQGLDIPSILLINNTQDLAVAPAMPFEAQMPASQTTIFAVEEPQGVAVASADALEALGGIASPATSPLDGTQSITATTSEPVTASMGVATATAAVIEALQGLAATGLVPVEALGAVASSLSFPLDEQGQILVSQTGVFFVEALAAAVQSALGPIESPQGIAAVGAFPLSALAGITQTGTSTIDMVKPAATTGLFPFSAPQGVTNTNQQIIDILAGLATTGVYPLDETKDLASTGLLPINSQAPASASGVFPVEALGVPIFAVSNTAQLFIEALGTVARTGQFPIAVSQDITTTATSAADTVAQAASLGLLPFESLAPTVTRTALLPIEAPGGVARTLLAAIEALGRVSPVAILPIDEATIVVLYVPADVTVQDQAVVVVTATDSPYATVLVTDGALVLVAVTDSVR